MRDIAKAVLALFLGVSMIIVGIMAYEAPRVGETSLRCDDPGQVISIDKVGDVYHVYCRDYQPEGE